MFERWHSFLYFFIILCASTAAPMEPVEPVHNHNLAPEQIEQMLAPYNDLLARVQSDEFIRHQLEAGEHYAAQYTDPEFLDNVLDPDKVRQQQQRMFNQTLLYAPLPDARHVSPIGVYHSDLMKISSLGIDWGLEWWFYKTFNQILAEAYVQQLIAAEPNPSLIKSIMPTMNKKIAGVLTAYAMATITMERTKAYLLLHEQDQLQPVPLASMIPQAAFLQGASPHSWVSFINACFKKIGLMPAWTDHYACALAQQCTALLLWLRWREYRTIMPGLKERTQAYHEQLAPVIARLQELTKNPVLNVEEKQERAMLMQTMRSFVEDSIQKPFMPWLVEKTIHLSVWHSITNIVIATPAWIRAGTWFYRTMQAVTAKPKE